MTDTFNVTAAYDKPSYNQGETMTITISGDDVLTETIQSQVGPVTIPVVAADGAQSEVSVPAITVQITTVSHLSVVIDTTRPVVDSSPTPRTWAVAANNLSISAVA